MLHHPFLFGEIPTQATSSRYHMDTWVRTIREVWGRWVETSQRDHLVVLTFRRIVLSSEHAHRKMNKSHIDMWSTSLPTDWSLRHQCSSRSMASNGNAGRASLTINYERYWFEWERTIELSCLILSAINYEHSLSVICIIVIEYWLVFPPSLLKLNKLLFIWLKLYGW
jgi:hypothetical protein